MKTITKWMSGARGLAFEQFGFQYVSFASFKHSKHWYNAWRMWLFLALEYFQVIVRLLIGLILILYSQVIGRLKREWESQGNGSLEAKSEDTHLTVKFIIPSWNSKTPKTFTLLPSRFTDHRSLKQMSQCSSLKFSRTLKVWHCPEVSSCLRDKKDGGWCAQW